MGLTIECTDSAKIAPMSNLVGIHKGKTPHRFHYIPEWAEKRGMKQVDLVREGNFDKGQVSRWWKGILPIPDTLVIIAGILQLEDVSSLFRHPDDDWLMRMFRDKTETDKQRAIDMLNILFQDHDTDPSSEASRGADMIVRTNIPGKPARTDIFQIKGSHQSNASHGKRSGNRSG